MSGQYTKLSNISDSQGTYGSMNLQEACVVAANNEPTNVVSNKKRRLSGSQLPTSRPFSTDSLTFALPTNVQTRNHAEESHGTNSWQHKVLEFLHSPQVEYTLMGLLLLDVFILFVELFLLAHYPSCDIIERDAISCCASSGEEHNRFLAEEASDAHEYCVLGSHEALEFPAACDEHKWHRVHTAEQALFIMTATILSIFFVELNLTMIALTPNVFFRQFFFLADYIIISFGLALEVLLHYISSASSQSLVGLLVTVRLWRFLRIGHGLVEVTHEVAEKEFEELLAYTEELEELLQKHQIVLPESSNIQKIKHERQGEILAEIAKHHRSKHTNHADVPK